MERNQQHIWSLGAYGIIRWQMPAMGRSNHNMYHGVAHLCPWNNLDSPGGFVPLDIALYCVVCSCWYWSLTFPWLGNQDTHWGKWCGFCTIIYGCYIFLCSILDQLRSRLQRQDARQYTKK
jgi:hypothetical protein